MISGKQLEFSERENVADEETQEFIDNEIAHAPKAPQELLERLQENHEASSPAEGRVSWAARQPRRARRPTPRHFPQEQRRVDRVWHLARRRSQLVCARRASRPATAQRKQPRR